MTGGFIVSWSGFVASWDHAGAPFNSIARLLLKPATSEGQLTLFSIRSFRSIVPLPWKTWLRKHLGPLPSPSTSTTAGPALEPTATRSLSSAGAVDTLVEPH